MNKFFENCKEDCRNAAIKFCCCCLSSEITEAYAQDDLENQITDDLNNISTTPISTLSTLSMGTDAKKTDKKINKKQIAPVPANVCTGNCYANSSKEVLYDAQENKESKTEPKKQTKIPESNSNINTKTKTKILHNENTKTTIERNDTSESSQRNDTSESSEEDYVVIPF